ncbi:MAG: hypothetical protein WCA37_17200 [Terracidiphilus sp.]
MSPDLHDDPVLRKAEVCIVSVYRAGRVHPTFEVIAPAGSAEKLPLQGSLQDIAADAEFRGLSLHCDKESHCRANYQPAPVCYHKSILPFMPAQSQARLAEMWKSWHLFLYPFRGFVLKVNDLQGNVVRALTANFVKKYGRLLLIFEEKLLKIRE